MTDVAQPVAAVLAGLKRVATTPAISALVPGGVRNDLPPSPTYPAVRLWARGKPVGPIAGASVWDVNVEIWIYSTASGDAEALAIAEAIDGELKAHGLTLDGWAAVVVAWEDLFPAGDEDLNGVPLKAWVMAFTVRVDQVA